MYYPQDVDIDVYGRGFDGIFGVGAQVKNHQQALMKLKAVRDFRSSVRKGEFIDSDLYGRADPRLFNQHVNQQPQSESQPLLTNTSSKTPKSFFSISIRKAKKLFPLSSSSNKSNIQHSSPSYQRLETITSDSDFEQTNQNNLITNNDSDDNLPKRVKSKLPSEEEQPFVEPGYVARAIESLNSDIDSEQKGGLSSSIKSPQTNIQTPHSASRGFSVQSSSDFSNVDRIISSPNISTEITNSTPSKDVVRRVQTTNSPTNYSNRTVYREKKNEALSQSPRSKSYGTPTNVQDGIGKSYSTSSAKNSSNSSASQSGGQVGRLAHLFETNQVQSTSTNELTTKESFTSAGLDDNNQTFSTSYENHSTEKKISPPRFGNLFSSNNASNEGSLSPVNQQNGSGFADKSEHDDEIELVEENTDRNITADRPRSKDALDIDPGVVPIATNSQYSSSSQKQSSMRSRSTTSSDRLGKLRNMFRSRGSKASAGSSSTDRKSSSTDRKRSFLSRSSLRASGLRSGSRSRQLSNNSTNRFFRGRGRSDHSQYDSLAASANFIPSSNSANTDTKISNERTQEAQSGTSSTQVISSGSPQEYASSRIIDSDRSAEAPSSTVIESSTTMEGEFEASEEVVLSNGESSSKKMTSSSVEVMKIHDSNEILADSDEEFKFVDVDADVDDFIDADANEEVAEITGQ